jgi:molecular chaperone DnaK
MPPRVLAAVVAAAVVLIAGVTYGAVALTSHGGNLAASGRTHNNARLTAPGSSAPSSPGPNPSSSLDSCLLGTWKQTLEQIPDTINGDPVAMSGGYGMIEIFSPDGAATVEYGGGTTYTATVNGNLWSQVVTGTATYDYTIQDGMLLSSDVNAHGTNNLYENGSYNNGGPLSLNTEPARFTCSGDSLQIFSPNGDSEDLTRQ